MSNDDVRTEVLAETENYAAWYSDEPDGEQVVHLELGPVTVHLYMEEWNEVLELVESAREIQAKRAKKKK